MRNSPAAGLTNFLPGAAGQPSCTLPATAFALHVPQVPVAHSYGRSIPARSPAYSTFSPRCAANLGTVRGDRVAEVGLAHPEKRLVVPRIEREARAIDQLLDRLPLLGLRHPRLTPPAEPARVCLPGTGRTPGAPCAATIPRRS